MLEFYIFLCFHKIAGLKVANSISAGMANQRHYVAMKKQRLSEASNKIIGVWCGEV